MIFFLLFDSFCFFVQFSNIEEKKNKKNSPGKKKVKFTQTKKKSEYK